mgnify:FL=1
MHSVRLGRTKIALRYFAAGFFAIVTAGLAGPVAAGDFFSFTSGPPPLGDIDVYPRSLNPARQSPGGGAGADTFFSSPGVDFNNLNANPAYFDRNNLLTRPATLISNEAFWTDPKIGSFNFGGSTFDVSSIGFSFDPVFGPIGADFGFDLALARVDTDLPTSSFFDAGSGNNKTAVFLPFQVQDENDFTARGELVFANGVSDIEFGESAFFAQQVGTFNTFNSPRTAWEGRFRFNQTDLQQLIANQNGGFGDDEDFPDDDGFDPSSIVFFDIDLDSVATFGGPSQIAIDNFVTNNAPVLDDPFVEPLLVRPFEPVGPNTPQYFIDASEEDSDPFPDAPETDQTFYDGDGPTEFNVNVNAASIGNGTTTDRKSVV